MKSFNPKHFSLRPKWWPQSLSMGNKAFSYSPSGLCPGPSCHLDTRCGKEKDWEAQAPNASSVPEKLKHNMSKTKFLIPKTYSSHDDLITCNSSSFTFLQPHSLPYSYLNTRGSCLRTCAWAIPLARKCFSLRYIGWLPPLLQVFTISIRPSLAATTPSTCPKLLYLLCVFHRSCPLLQYYTVHSFILFPVSCLPSSTTIKVLLT